MKVSISEKYRIKHNETDFNGQLSLPSAGDLLLDAAGLHAADIQTSITNLNSQNLTWVISGMKFNINCMPKINQEITVTTNVSDYTKFSTQRDFRIYDNENQILAEISSEWLIIDINTRRPVFITDILPQLEQVCQPENQVEKYHRLRFTLDEDKKISQHKISYPDIDINKHLYSMNYLRLALSTFEIEKFQHQKIKSLNLNFISEMLQNQTAVLYLNNIENTSQIEIKESTTNKSTFKAEILWQ